MWVWLNKGIIFAYFVPRVGHFEICLEDLQIMDESDGSACYLTHIRVISKTGILRVSSTWLCWGRYIYSYNISQRGDRTKDYILLKTKNIEIVKLVSLVTQLYFETCTQLIFWCCKVGKIVQGTYFNIFCSWL